MYLTAEQHAIMELERQVEILKQEIKELRDRLKEFQKESQAV